MVPEEAHQARSLQGTGPRPGGGARRGKALLDSLWSPEQARHPLVARLQSSLEQHVLEAGGARTAIPVDFHQACVAISDWLLASQDSADSLHAGVAPYPLSVVEAFALKFGLVAKLGFNVSKNAVSYRIFIELADRVSRFGYDSREARDFYSTTICTYTGNRGFAADAGWLNEFLGTLETYLGPALGTHHYRRVPWHPLSGYDHAFSVSELPRVKGRPLVVGVLADWANGAAGSHFVLQELAKQNPDIVVHLGDTYYSGTTREARDFFLAPMIDTFGKDVPIFQVPGNHDYYSGGEGFFDVTDHLGYQKASFFALRGEQWQIIGIDTGLLDSFQLSGLLSHDERANRATMTFLPSDQEHWVLEQIRKGKQLGLKTIMMSHHQFFSRRESLGYANGAIKELSTLPDRLHGVYETNAFRTKSDDLPGHLPADVAPAVNTRLLSQFPPDALASVAAFYWGHEHSSTIFEPYAGIRRGRLVGNGCIPVAVDYDIYAVNPATNSSYWGGPPKVVEGSRIGRGKDFWNLGFATIALDGGTAHAKYFEIEQTTDEAAPFAAARVFFEERY